MNKESVKQYYCPMHCEGDKMYDQPGNCPICNMKLIQVSEGHHQKNK